MQVPVLWARSAVNSGRSWGLNLFVCSVGHGYGTACSSADSAERKDQMGFLWNSARAIWWLGDVASSSLGHTRFSFLSGLFGRTCFSLHSLLLQLHSIVHRGRWKWVSVAWWLQEYLWSQGQWVAAPCSGLPPTQPPRRQLPAKRQRSFAGPCSKGDHSRISLPCNTLQCYTLNLSIWAK